MKKSLFNIVVGLGFLAAAVLVIVGQFGYLKEIGTTSLVMSVVLGILVFVGLVKLRPAYVLFGLALLAIIWDKKLGITMITPKPVLLAALFGSIGIEVLFKNTLKKYRRKIKESHYKKNFTYNSKKFEDIKHFADNGDPNFTNRSDENGEYVYKMSKFGDLVTYLTSNNLKQVDLDLAFSGAKIYFDKAKSQTGVVRLNIKANFSGAKIYIPKSWQVSTDQTAKFCAGVKINEGMPTGENEVTLFIDGNLNFSGVEVYYI